MAFNFSNFIDLIKAIADTHKSVNGFLFGNWEDLQAILRSSIDYPFLFLELPRGSLQAVTPDHFVQELSCKLYIVNVYEKGDIESKINALKDIYLLKDDIVSYFRKVSYPNPQFEYEGLEHSPLVGLTVDNMIGLEIRFVVNYAANLTFKPERWEE